MRRCAVARPDWRSRRSARAIATNFPAITSTIPDFQTEWWYYTGNLRAAEGRRFGFELTFFRQASTRDRCRATQPSWDVRDVWLAHLALSDIDGGRFLPRRAA